MSELEKLSNIGKEMVRQLNEIGITTAEQSSLMSVVSLYLNGSQTLLFPKRKI